jgi:hypothetical protein
LFSIAAALSVIIDKQVLIGWQLLKSDPPSAWH